MGTLCRYHQLVKSWEIGGTSGAHLDLMGLQRGATSSSDSVRHIWIAQRASLDIFLCSLESETSLKASEHPSHHLQGSSNIVVIQNSLPNGAMVNEKDIQCRTADRVR